MLPGPNHDVARCHRRGAHPLVPLLAMVAGLLLAPIPGRALTLADWTFEDLGSSIPAGTNFSQNATSGSGSLLVSHASSSASYTRATGNGSTYSLNSNGWAINDYFQFSTSTLNSNAIQLSWDQTGSATGPKNFRLSTSIDNTTFTPFLDYAVLLNGAPNSSWNTTGYQSNFTRSVNLSGVTSLNNRNMIYLRLAVLDNAAINAGGILGAGTSRIDNVRITGSPIPAAVPVPLPLLGAAAALAQSRRLRRRLKAGQP